MPIKYIIFKSAKEAVILICPNILLDYPFCKYAGGQFVNVYYKSIKKEMSNMFISLDPIVLL